MSCRDWESYGSVRTVEDTRRVDMLSRRVDMLSRIACNLARAYEAKLGNIVDTNADLSRETRDWWQRHKKQDAKRAALKAREKEREAAKQKAIKKLTAEERRLLNL